ncbi:hypothetical protein AYI68_g6875 [Smittium mucronatum]|uniref:Arrestin-like N-terminal domain-containing protein n=1 Tax=Smittium mucronatum TaxID=133383 RepID=A0A1R0GQ98_9FUNG|nr:hypothetical protein AYI68_g6875 [Smittium mucronatum]
MLKSSRLDVILHSDSVVFHGSESNASPKLIYGKVRVHNKSISKIKSLSVSVTGVSSYGFVNENYESPSFNVNNCYASKSVVFDHKEILYQSNDSNGSNFGPGVYEYLFIIKMDGDLPASVITEFGKTEYKLKVVLEKANILSMNATKTLPIFVKRIIELDTSISHPSIPTTEAESDVEPPSFEAFSNPLVSTPSPASSFIDLPSASSTQPTNLSELSPRLVSKTFDDKIMLKMITDGTVYTSDQKLKVSVELNPLNETTRVISIGAVLNERVSIYGTNNSVYGGASKSYLRIINSVHKNLSVVETVSKSEFFSSNSFQLELNTSKDYKIVQLDIENETFKVSHYIKVYVIIDYKGKREKLFSLIPIYIVPNEYFTEFNNLPLYSASELDSPPAYSSSLIPI